MTLFSENIAKAENPEWEEFDNNRPHVHDWQTYITDEVRKHWAAIDLEARCVAIHIAESCAGLEEWD